MTDTLERLRTALAGRYEIEKEIGVGGMATVYIAHDVKHDRDVAIKVLHPDLGAALGSERFLSEIKTTAKLQHPHILPLLDSGDADGLLYYVMPVVTGESLRVRLEREGQLSINEAIRIAKETASALDYAHRHGVIHRDIKPENILLHDGQAIVGDFGIALAVSAAGGARMTQTGLSLGTPQYMSPEQAMGERTVDARSDVYSLGAVTYEMLTGDAPFTGNSVQAIVSKIMTQRPTPISAVRDTIPEAVENAVMIALSKLPADRFASAAEFATALTSPTTAFARTSGDLPRSGPGRRRVDVIAQRVGIPAIAIAVIASALAIWGWMRPQPPRQVSRYAIEFDSTTAMRGGGRRFAISPDGSTMAFVGGPQGKLFMRPTSSLTMTPLPGTEGAGAPFFSPDGKFIAYTDFQYEMLMVPVTGGQPVLIADSLVSRNQGSWSPDGYIYVGPRLPDGLYRVRAAEHSAPQRFTTLDTAAHEMTHSLPSALPNGKGVLFTVAYRSGKSPAIAVSDKNGKHRILFTGTGPAYSPSGHILYLSGNGALSAVPFDESSMKVTGEPLEVLGLQIGSVPGDFGSGTIGSIEADVSRTGTLLYSNRSSAGTELVWVSRDGKAVPVDPEGPGQYGFPEISPDGSRVVLSAIIGNKQTIWVKQLDRGPAHRLTINALNTGYPAWLPDGTSVSFYSSQTDPRLSLWKTKADGSDQPAPLRSIRNPVESEWSPDGKWMIFRTSVQNPGKGDILAIRPGIDSVPIPIAVTPFADQSPAISRDGRWIAYSSNESGRFEIYVVPFPNAGAAKWTVSTDGGSEPIWAHSGRELFYRTGSGNLVSVQVSSSPTFSLGAAKVLFSASEYSASPSHRGYDVSHDDSRFLMVRQRRGTEADNVNVVENWFEELKTLSKK